jgi:hypothetical protein
MLVSGHHAPATVPTGKEPWYPVDRRLVESQNWSGYSGKEKKFLPLPGNEQMVIQPVAQSLY